MANAIQVDPKALSELERQVSTWLTMFVDEWLQAAEEALRHAFKPTEEDAQASWYEALAGNLVWASATLLPGVGPAAQFLIIAFSLGGATLASDANRPTETVFSDEEVGNYLAQLADKLEELLKKNKAEYAKWILTKALSSADEPVTDPDVQQMLLWNKIFYDPYKWRPSSEDFVGGTYLTDDARWESRSKEQLRVLYSSRRAELREKMLQQINSVLSQFKRQYKEWRRPIDILSLSTGYPIAQQRIEEYEKKHPFEPTLYFDLSGVKRD